MTDEPTVAPSAGDASAADASADDVSVTTAPSQDPPQSSVGILAIAAGAVEAFAAGTVADHRPAVALFAALAATQLLWGIVTVRYASRALGGLGVLLHLGALAVWIGATTSGLSFVEGLGDAHPFDATAVVVMLLSAAAGFASLARLVDDRPPEQVRVQSERTIWAVTTLASVAVVVAAAGSTVRSSSDPVPAAVVTSTTVPGPIGLPKNGDGNIDQQLGSLIQASENSTTVPVTTRP